MVVRKPVKVWFSSKMLCSSITVYCCSLFFSFLSIFLACLLALYLSSYLFSIFCLVWNFITHRQCCSSIKMRFPTLYKLFAFASKHLILLQPSFYHLTWSFYHLFMLFHCGCTVHCTVLCIVISSFFGKKLTNYRNAQPHKMLQKTNSLFKTIKFCFKWKEAHKLSVVAMMMVGFASSTHHISCLNKI